MLIQFGYVTLFAAADPIIVIIVFFLMYFEKFIDTIKLFYLVRMEIIDQCNGLEIYNSIFKGLVYIGVISNVSIVVFSKEYYLFGISEHNVVFYKAFLSIGVIFFIYAICFVYRYNILPKWFQHKDEIVELYQKMYFNRGAVLPHLKIERTLRKKAKGKGSIKEKGALIGKYLQ